MVNREIGFMIQFQHPTIIKFIGYSLKDVFNENNATIFMKYCKKGSLNDYIKKIRANNANGQYNNTIGQIILVGIARGMMYLHQQQIVHRDLKPGNVLLDNQLHPHITDFGLSKVTLHDRMMDPSQPYGTFFYLAPEGIESDQYNKKADVYSFGIILYEIVTKRVPYPMATPSNIINILNKISKENFRPSFNVLVKPSIKSLIESCWARDPDERPTFEEIFKKLAYNQSEFKIDVYNNENEPEQEDFYMEGVDIQKVREYADFINNPELAMAKKKYQDEIERLQSENSRLRQQCTALFSETHNPATDNSASSSSKDTDNSASSSSKNTDNSASSSSKDTDNSASSSSKDTDNSASSSSKDTDNSASSSSKDTENSASSSSKDTDSPSEIIRLLNLPDEFIDQKFSRNWNNCLPNKQSMRGGKPYYLPVGFVGIGLHVENFVEDWCVAYKGVKIRSIPSILRDGFKLPSQLLGDRTGKLPLNIQLYGVSNFADAIFVSPSHVYASLSGMNIIDPAPEKRTEKNILISLLQVRVRPNSFSEFPNTTMYEPDDPHYNNNELEWRITNPKDVVPYRVLIRKTSQSEIHQLLKRRVNE